MKRTAYIFPWPDIIQSGRRTVGSQLEEETATRRNWDGGLQPVDEFTCFLSGAVVWGRAIYSRALATDAVSMRRSQVYGLKLTGNFHGNHMELQARSILMPRTEAVTCKNYFVYIVRVTKILIFIQISISQILTHRKHWNTFITSARFTPKRRSPKSTKQQNKQARHGQIII